MHQRRAFDRTTRTGAALGAAVLAACLACGCAHAPGAVDRAGEAALASRLGRAEAGAATAPAATGARAPLAPSAPGVAGAAAKGSEGAAGPGPTAAPDGFLAPLGKDGDQVPLALEDCLRRALAHNLSIQIARFSPAIAETRVVEAEAVFDPAYFMNNAAGRTRRETGSFISGATILVAKEWDFSSGIGSLLPTGATVSLSQDWTYLETNSAFINPNPQYAASMPLAVRQPLLRGAGLVVNRSPILLARMDRDVSLADFQVRLMDTLLEVERTYWQLVVAQRRVEAVSEALAAARENRRVVQRRFEEGRDRRVLVSLADSAVTSREADLIVARLDQARTSDQLKRFLNDPELPLEEPVILRATDAPLSEPAPVDEAVLQRSMVAAMQYRPEMAQAQTRLAQQDLRERVARHERLPRMDLVGAYGLTGLSRAGRDLDWALHRQFGTELFEWSAGVEFEVPLGNRAAVAAYKRAHLEREQALKQREDTRQAILLEVSTAVRDLAAAEKAILATRAAREAAEQTLRDQQANVGAGAALQKDLLDAQKDLADARVREVQAMAAYMASLAALERAKGSLLEYNNVRLVGDEAAPADAPAAAPAP